LFRSDLLGLFLLAPSVLPRRVLTGFNPETGVGSSLIELISDPNCHLSAISANFLGMFILFEDLFSFFF